MSDESRHAYLTPRSTLICAGCHQPIRRGLDWIGPDFTIKKCERDLEDGSRCNTHHHVSQSAGSICVMLQISRSEFQAIRKAARNHEPVSTDRIYEELGVYGPPARAVGE